MPELKLSTQDNYTQFYPGETLSGAAEWTLDAPARAIEVRLFWFTQGKGDVDVQVVDTARVDEPALHGRHEFAFTLPDSPYSFSGKLISLIWALELVVLPGGQSERLEFTMSPTGQEVLLYPAAGPAQDANE